MELDAVVDMLEAVAWMVCTSPGARGKVAAHYEMYCQKASLVNSP